MDTQGEHEPDLHLVSPRRLGRHHRQALRSAGGGVRQGGRVLSDEVESLIDRIQELLDQNRYAKALLLSERVLQLAPKSGDAWACRGHVLRNLELHEEALAAYDQALALDADDAFAWNGRGSALLGLKRYEEALAAYDRALSIAETAGRWKNKAISLRGLGRTADAEAAERRAKALGG